MNMYLVLENAIPACAAPRELPKASETSQSLLKWRRSLLQIAESNSSVYPFFKRFHCCCGLIPTSSKSEASFASATSGFCGHADHHHRCRKSLKEHKSETQRKVYQQVSFKRLVCIFPNATSSDAVSSSARNKIHRLPVVDPESGNTLYILTLKGLPKFPKFIMEFPKPEFMSKPLEELQIGTSAHVATACTTSPVCRVVDVRSMFDAVGLAVEKTYVNLDVSVTQALQHRSHSAGGRRGHRLVVVDGGDGVKGILAPPDILRSLVLMGGEKP
ncbi:unnamed protein product [Nyctereutes procyonoides]|uniref:5'-AMP-activated protein kinase subunit gamma-1 n=1 Tax=Nyctereutes procyonoides TaxID=34880 RepID=A0A811YKK5_NYCPR|nr:unnamed protein product [Nyctereutes procyonoides]